jgi:hypothetical protein
MKINLTRIFLLIFLFYYCSTRCVKELKLDKHSGLSDDGINTANSAKMAICIEHNHQYLQHYLMIRIIQSDPKLEDFFKKLHKSEEFVENDIKNNKKIDKIIKSKEGDEHVKEEDLIDITEESLGKDSIEIAGITNEDTNLNENKLSRFRFKGIFDNISKRKDRKQKKDQEDEDGQVIKKTETPVDKYKEGHSIPSKEYYNIPLYTIYLLELYIESYEDSDEKPSDPQTSNQYNVMKLVFYFKLGFTYINFVFPVEYPDFKKITYTIEKNRMHSYVNKFNSVLLNINKLQKIIKKVKPEVKKHLKKLALAANNKAARNI